MIRWGLDLNHYWLAMKTPSLVAEGTHKQTPAQGGSPVVKAGIIAGWGYAWLKREGKHDHRYEQKSGEYAWSWLKSMFVQGWERILPRQ